MEQALKPEAQGNVAVEPVAWRWRVDYRDAWCWSDTRPEFSPRDLESGSVFDIQPLVPASSIASLSERLAEVEQENTELRAKLAEAVEAEREACIKAASIYCWERYKGREPLNLSSPAVFTSHEWQKIEEAIRRARAFRDATHAALGKEDVSD